jgi:MtrB/PioB family decaheme-associated outer membrane protein
MTMRTKPFGMAAALLLLSAGARAQTPASAGAAAPQDVPQTAAASVPDIPATNSIEFGWRGTSFSSGSDKARYQRYEDLRNGATVDRFRFMKSTDAYLFTAQADHIGYLDQRFSGAYNNYGRVKASFEWSQTPLFYSEDTLTLYSSGTPGVLTLPDPLQTALQNKTTTLQSAVAGGSTFELRSRRDEAKFNLVYVANPNLDVVFNVRNINKNGSQAYAAGFGFSNAIELAAPVDTRTTELGAGVEWSNEFGFAKLDYLGSYFRNNVGALTWDNPLRVSDSSTLGPAAGRMALWPNSDQNTASASGSIKFAGRSRATAYVSIGNLTQNDSLIPYTINTALTSPALDRPTADLLARVTAMNYTVTSRPTGFLWLSARYRQYQFDNRSAPFHVAQSVNYDTAVTALNEETGPLGYTRHTFDADASVTPIAYLAFRAGYTREEIDRTFRVVDKTTEDTARASVDVTGVAWMTVRGIYEHGQRRGSPVDRLELLSIGEQPGLRQFDISDRDHDRVSGIVTVTPIAMLSLNGSLSYGKENYLGGTFGLRNNDNHVYSVGVDFVPDDRVNLGVTYGWEKYNALETSRTANPLPENTIAYLLDPTQQFNDPRRDWSDTSADRVRTLNAALDLVKLLPRMDVKIGYDYSRATSTYIYGLPANTVIAAPVQLPAVLNVLQRGTFEARYFVTKRLAVGGVYWYDNYTVNDFALGPLGLALPTTGTATFMQLGNYYRPYTANTFSARLTYLW